MMSADPHNHNAVGSRKKEPLHTGENIEMLFKKKKKKAGCCFTQLQGRVYVYLHRNEDGTLSTKLTFGLKVKGKNPLSWVLKCL